MNKFRALLEVSFRAKVLVPVVGVMVLLIVLLMWTDSRRTVRQVQAEATRQVATAEAVFNRWQQSRASELLLRYQIAANEPRFKAVAGQADLKTFRYFLDGLIDEKLADVIVVATGPSRQVLSATRNPRIDLTSFERRCNDPLERALNGQSGVNLVHDSSSIFDLVAIPIRVNDEVEGAVCFGIENSIAQEFNQLTRSELVLFADGRVVASSMSRPEWQSELTSRYRQYAGNRDNPAHSSIGEIRLSDEHFLCTAGELTEVGQSHHLGYLILSSYEEPLRILRSTQHTILLLGSLAILVGTTIVWVLIQKVTQPLRELRDSVEAVGRGDFSRRVEVRSQDECGELARVFNQMTENLKNSHEQLETAVDTLKTTQAQLVQSEKLSGIGEFIAGVAHELNNPLTSVMGFSELLRQVQVDPQYRRYLDMIHKSAMRCQKIVQALLSFARRQAPERKPVCVNRLIEAALDILSYQFRTSNIEPIARLDPNLPQAMVDPHQIQQVLVNLLNNARQAIEANQPAGWIRITTERAGNCVRVTLQDNGPGIPSENLSKIFDPFFTTKEVGVGTGLGLSLCYGIIKEHGGTIKPICKAGEGATFIIELPVTHSKDTEVTTVAEPAAPPPDPTEGRGRKVLVIDDEEPILQMVRETLSACGYQVDLASDGETGLRRLRETRYDLTLCDCRMPGLSGPQVYERLRQTDPKISEKFIFITGDVIGESTRRFLEKHQRICLPKPFTLTEFRAAVKRAVTAK